MSPRGGYSPGAESGRVAGGGWEGGPPRPPARGGGRGPRPPPRGSRGSASSSPHTAPCRTAPAPPPEARARAPPLPPVPSCLAARPEVDRGDPAEQDHHDEERVRQQRRVGKELDAAGGRRLGVAR